LHCLWGGEENKAVKNYKEPIYHQAGLAACHRLPIGKGRQGISKQIGLWFMVRAAS